MENSLFPAATSEIGKKRGQLTPETLNTWRAFSRQVFTEGNVAREDQGAHRGGGCSCDAMPVLHSRAHEKCPPKGRNGERNHGSYLGSR
jgi:hypothetical protein